MPEPTRTIVCAPPSQLLAELSKANGLLSVVVRDEPRSLECMLAVLSYLRRCAVHELDLGALGPFDRDEGASMGFNMHDNNASSTAGLCVPAFYSALVGLSGLTRLRVGKACLDQASGADASGKWDVEYLCDAIPEFQCLRALDLRGLNLTAADGCDVLIACKKCPSLRELDLSDNSLHDLSDVLYYCDVVCHLDSLNLSGNALGEMDEDSVGSDLTCHALMTLITQYTSLRELDLSTNLMGNREGWTIAEALCKCTHLRELNLRGNYWVDKVDASIKAAWQGEAERLFL
jgi:hypothetical protein